MPSSLYKVSELTEKATAFVQGRHIPYVVPGDQISLGDTPEVVLPNKKLREDPVCPHFGVCGGCSMQHMSETYYYQFKQESLVRALETIDVHPEPCVRIPYGRRRRLILKATSKGLGFYAIGTHKLVPITTCALVTEAITYILRPLSDFIATIIPKKGVCHVFITDTEAGLDIVFDGALTHIDTIPIFAQAHNNIARIYHSSKSVLLYQVRSPYVCFGRYRVPLSPGGFLQATPDMERVVIDTISPYMRGCVMDLFCGRGTFSLPFVSQCKSMVCIDTHETALKDLKSSQAPITVEKQDLFHRPVPASRLSSYDCVLINPPRAGAKEQVREIARSSCSLSVYISCNMHTFCRDARILMQSGFQVKRVIPIDQFIWSHHMELCAIFVRSLKD